MDERVAGLLARLGNSDRAARELIELGEMALAAVDALAADPTQRLEARRAASLVAHQIRDRLMRAPAAPVAAPAWPGGEIEARAWIARGGTISGDGFGARHEARTFIEALYAAGSPHVAVTEHARVLVAALPAADPDARAHLIAVYNAEVDALGEEFGGEETAGHALTRDEAIALGHPEAEGEWCVDDLHVADTGQLALRFGWD